MHLFINSLAASAGGGLTYVRNVIPILAARSDVHVTIVLSSELRREFLGYPAIEFIEAYGSSVRRLWYEQSVIPKLAQERRADVLVSAGNFAVRNSAVPQILLSRNSIYTSSDFYRDLLSRHEYRNWLDTRLRGMIAKKSVGWASVTVAPSDAFAAELRRWTGAPNVVTIHHGFDREAFLGDQTHLSPEIEQPLHEVRGSLKLLFVSHYNYYRNFETLIRALPLIRDRLSGRKVRVLLTCKLARGENPGSYDPKKAATLVKKLGVSEMVVQLGTIPYSQLHQIYSLADIYVTPAYTETFAHPLIEAMSTGLPVVASDLPVHREICEDAALYFPRFSPEALADRVVEVAGNENLRHRLSERGIQCSSSFSWVKHVDELLSVAQSLISKESMNGWLAPASGGTR